MEMNKENVKKLISKLVVTHRNQVIKAVSKSGYLIKPEISDRDLYKLIIDGLDSRNGELVVHLGALLDRTFNLESVEIKSNYTGFALTPDQLAVISEATSQEEEPPKTSWFKDFWSKNQEGIISSGAGLLGNLFGGEKDTPPTQPAGMSDTEWIKQMKKQQALSDSQYSQDSARREQEAKKRRQTMIIGGSIVGVLLIGGIITAIVISRR